jgi:hypothetical protein
MATNLDGSGFRHTLFGNSPFATLTEPQRDGMRESVVARLVSLTGSRRRAKWSLLSLVLLVLLGYTWLFQAAEDRARSSLFSRPVPTARPSLAPTPSPTSNGNEIGSGTLTPPTSFPTSFPTALNGSSPLHPLPPVTLPGDGSTTTTTTTAESADAQSGQSAVSFWLSIALSLLLWVAILQMVQYLRRPYRLRNAQDLAGSRRQLGGEVELLRAFLMMHSGDARRRLQLLQRDFTAEDYEMLQGLDDDENRSGAAQQAIDQLPVRKLRAADLAEYSAASGQACNVCLGPYEVGEDVRTLPCLHQFHKDCIDNWLRRRAVCPICKCSVVRSDEDNL